MKTRLAFVSSVFMTTFLIASCSETGEQGGWDDPNVLQEVWFTLHQDEFDGPDLLSAHLGHDFS